MTIYQHKGQIERARIFSEQARKMALLGIAFGSLTYVYVIVQECTRDFGKTNNLFNKQQLSTKPFIY